MQDNHHRLLLHLAWRRAALLLGLLVAAGLVFLVPPYNFLQFEDAAYITANPLVANGLSWESFKLALIHTPENNWIPATWWLMAAESGLSGTIPQALTFRVVSLFLHAFAALLIWELAGRPGISWLAILGLGLFLIHPQRVEPVVWASSQKDLLSTVLAVGALLAWRRFLVDDEKGRFAVAALAMFLLGIMAKQSIIALPVICWLMMTGQRLTMRNGLALGSMILVAALGVLAALRANRHTPGAPPSFDLPWWDPLLNAPAAWAWQIKQTIFPGAFFPEYGRPDAWVVYAILGFASFAFIGWLVWRGKLGWAWLAWPVAFIPVSGLVPLPMPFTADRLHYFPSALLALAILSPGLGRQHPPAALRKFPAIGAMAGSILLLLFWSGLSRKQSAIWADDKSLFSHTLQAAPEHGIALTNMGVLHMQEGALVEAEGWFVKATKADRQLLRPWQNLVYLRIHLGRPVAAADAAAQAAKHFEDDPGPLLLLAAVAESTGDFSSALHHSVKAAALAPYSPTPIIFQCRMLAALGRQAEIPILLDSIPAAVRRHPEILKFHPDHEGSQ